MLDSDFEMETRVLMIPTIGVSQSKEAIMEGSGIGSAGFTYPSMMYRIKMDAAPARRIRGSVRTRLETARSKPVGGWEVDNVRIAAAGSRATLFIIIC